MKAEFRAGDEPVSARREYWQHLAGQALGALDLRVTGEIDGADRIVAGHVGAIRLGQLTARYPGGAVRTARHVRRTDSELFKIDIPLDGGGIVDQDGRQAVLRAGDFAFVDLSRPARWQMAPRRVVAVLFPVRLLPIRADQVRRLTATAIPGDRGSGALVPALAARMAGHLGEYGPAEAARLGGAMLDLVGAALAGHLDTAVTPEAHERAVTLQVYGYIEEHLPDPGLSPAVVASANHLSVRALHRLFERHDTTVAAWIRQRRLERVRRDLLDPALRARPVSAIGARWGLPDPSHLSRAFRAEYGTSPTAYRSQVSPPGPPPGPA
ncbi:helix-turn-helix domain-containing protein [Actinoplanes sp. NPDC051513]|uniref:helix-turn-helix domain-containing protein n=1 Tax=Actinoplanes sp. NPDC051513 TaxID=3363908 RepID=UPI0037978EBA